MGKGKALAIKRGIFYKVYMNGMFSIMYKKEDIEKRADELGIGRENIEWEDGGVGLI